MPWNKPFLGWCCVWRVVVHPLSQGQWVDDYGVASVVSCCVLFVPQQVLFLQPVSLPAVPQHDRGHLHKGW